MLGNGPVRFGGRPHGKGPAQRAPRRAAHPVRVLSRLPLTTSDPVAVFPDKPRAIQQGDKLADNTTAMGRPALQVRVRIQDTDIDLIAAHFKSKLLIFPPTDSAPTTRASAPGSVPTRSIAEPLTLSSSAELSCYHSSAVLLAFCSFKLWVFFCSFTCEVCSIYSHRQTDMIPLVI